MTACPFCQRETKPHCEEVQCDWLRCTTPGCGATVSQRRRRAMRINPTSLKTEYVTT